MRGDRYEELAARFYAETGVMAPGKDVARGARQDDQEERWRAWCQWLESQSPRTKGTDHPNFDPVKGWDFGDWDREGGVDVDHNEKRLVWKPRGSDE